MGPFSPYRDRVENLYVPNTGVFFLHYAFLPATRISHPIQIRRHLIIELICESVKINSKILNQLAGLLTDVLFSPQYKLPNTRLCPLNMRFD